MKNHADNQNTLNFLESSLARNLAWVAAADSKVPSIFAIDMGMLGIWCALAPKMNEWPVFTAVLSAFTVLTLLASILSLALVAFPRLDGPKGSAVFFGGIVQHSEEVFLKKMRGGVSEEIFDDLARQTYRNAEIAKGKFAHVRWAIICMFASVPFWLASIALLYAAR